MSLDEVKRCPSCGIRYNTKYVYRCPKCGVRL